MKYTNRFHFPAPLFRALCSVDEYELHGDFSMTGLIAPPQIAVLTNRHKDKIVKEVSGNMYALRGNAMHEVVAKFGKVPGAIIEERFIINILGKQVSMESDTCYPLRYNEYEILDYKDPAISAISKGAKIEWIIQLNGYRYGMMKLRGFNVVSLKIVCFLRDWSYTDCFVRKVRDYPQSEIVILDVPLWPLEKIKAYLEERVRLHSKARLLSDKDLPECTPQERWLKDECFAAVYLTGKSKGRAINGGGRFKTEREAKEFIQKRKEKGKEKKDFHDAKVEFRQGESIRCERYCQAKPFCWQYNHKINPKGCPF